MPPSASLLYCGKHDAAAKPQEEGPRERGAGPRHTQTGFSISFRVLFGFPMCLHEACIHVTIRDK